MSKKKIYLISTVAVVAIVILLSGQFLKTKDNSDLTGPTYTVKHGPLTISFVESGTIKAREQTIIKNEVEGKTSIISIIPEGTRVKKGDLLIELDASTLQDQKIDRDIAVQNTEAEYIGAKESLAVVENQAKSDVDLAKLTLDFARQDLDKYIKGEHPYELDKANADITLAEEQLTRADETLKWSEKLFEQNYISKTEMEADKLSKDEKELAVKLANKSKDLLIEYTYKRNLAKFQSDVNQAEMAMERTERKAKADVIQSQAQLKAKQSEYERQKDKLAKVKDQISKTKIYAPTDGLAIYATSAKGEWWRNEPLAEGTQIEEKEELIYLPTGNSSKAEVTIHESNLKKTSKGMPVIITIDAVPGTIFYGTVESIAPLPDARSMWMNPDLKVYTTEIYIDGNDPTLRTGMSCQAEIIIQQYKDAIYVPLQTVIKMGTDFNVYVKSGKSFEPRKVKIGLDNNKVIHIIEGLKDGDIVLLNPPLKSAAADLENRNSLNEENKKELNRKISEKLKNLEANLPAADTNQLSTNKSQNMQDIKEKTHQTHDRKKHEGSESQGKKEGKQ